MIAKPKSNPDKVFHYLQKNPRSSGPAIAKALGLTEAAVSVALKRLRQRGAIGKLEQRIGNRWEWVVLADATPEFRAKILAERPQGWGKTYHREPKDICTGDGGRTLAQLLGYGA